MSKTNQPKYRSLGGGVQVRTVPRGDVARRVDRAVDQVNRKTNHSRAPKRPGIEEDSNVAFYWAYGSNLNVKQMRKRCPGAQPAGAFVVKGARLVFRGVADVVVEEGSFCAGGLWKITPRCERELDAYEGVGSGLYLKKYFKVRRSKHVYKCLFYQMRGERGVVPPGQHYLDSIVQGYRDFDLDLDLLDVAVQEAWGNKKMTPRLRERQVRRGETNMVRDLYSST